MFRKLKLQFIFTNLAIITALFVSLTVGAYILLQINMINHAEFFSQRLAAGINSGILPGFPTPEHGRAPRFMDRPLYDNKRPPGPFGPFGSIGSPHEKKSYFPPVFFIKTDPKGGTKFHSFKQPFDAVHFKFPVKQILKTKKTSGTINFLHSKYFYYKTSLQKEPGMLLVFLDLKQEKNIQLSLVISLIITGIIYLFLSMAGSLFMANRAIGPIQKAWQQQKDFLADASHELRTPLAIIQTNLEVVLSNPQETVASQSDWLNNVQEELQQMTILVSSLLFLARIDSQHDVINKSYFPLDKVVARVSEAFKPIILGKNINLCTAITSNITCYGDESNIRQVLEILLDNAIRHTPCCGKIVLNLAQSEKKILLTVADTGDGIAPEHLDKIFDRFYQEDASRSKGTAGLGLSIAKCIIESHGGTIQVASVLGSGTTFTIQLPLLKNRITES